MKGIIPQPEASGKITSSIIIGAALAEQQQYYGFVSQYSLNCCK
jgi:F0F1-type ATP synthase membrane subunit c/vacuolar-type H+-ATPase subunit K